MRLYLFTDPLADRVHHRNWSSEDSEVSATLNCFTVTHVRMYGTSFNGGALLAG